MFCDIIMTWCKTSCGSSYCTGVITFCIKMLKIPFVSLLIALYSCLVTSSSITLVKRRGTNVMVHLLSCPLLPWPIPAKATAHSSHESHSALWHYLGHFWFYSDLIMIYLKAWGLFSGLESFLLIPSSASVNSGLRKLSQILKTEEK